jgi:hypothetical protein
LYLDIRVSLKVKRSGSRGSRWLLASMTAQGASTIVPVTNQRNLGSEGVDMELSIDNVEVNVEAAAAFERTEEEQRVHEWRAEQLEILGLSRVVAETFASRVDWHQVAELVKRGCSAELALEILR